MFKRSLFKKLLLWPVLLLALLLIGVNAFVFLINPNDFKPTLEKKITAITGLPCTIHGKIDWSIYPWASLHVTQIVIHSAADAADDTPLATIREARVSLKLWPLIHRKVEISDVMLVGVSVQLHCDKDGTPNWDVSKVSSTSKPTAAKPQQQRVRVARWQIDDLEVLDAAITYTDAKTHREVTWQNGRITATHISSDNLFSGSIPLDVDGTVSLAPENYLSDFALHLELSWHSDTQTLSLDSGIFMGKATLPNRDAAPLPFRLQVKGNFSPTTETLSLPILTGQISGMRFSANLSGSIPAAKPNIDGQLSIAPFQLNRVLHPWLATFFDAYPDSTFSKFAMQTDFHFDQAGVNLTHLRTQLDQSTFTGQAAFGWALSAPMHLRGHIDTLPLDTYVSQTGSSQSVSTHPVMAMQPATVLFSKQLALLQRLVFSTELKIDALHYRTLKANNVSLALSGKQGKWMLSPLEANVFQGNLLLRGTADFSQDVPRYAVSQTLENVPSSELLRLLKTETDSIQGHVPDWLNELPIDAGNMTVSLSLMTQGTNRATLLKALSGTGKLTATGGTLQGINTDYYFSLADALLSGQPAPQVVGPNQTNFSDVSASFTLENGVLQNSDLLLHSPVLQLSGKGQIDLTKQSIDYDLFASRLSHPSQTTALHGWQLPLRITGNFAHPKIAPNMKLLAAKHVHHTVKKIKQKVSDLIGQNLGKRLSE